MNSQSAQKYWKKTLRLTPFAKKSLEEEAYKWSSNVVREEGWEDVQVEFWVLWGEGREEE